MKKQNKCAFCGKPTNYYSYELVCYVCPKCLGEYKKASATPVYFKIKEMKK
jgi:NMD protein affecting ribosome stability and mRNA decay